MNEKPKPPWEVYFDLSSAAQNRKDGKIEVSMSNIEYIVFLAQPKPRAKWTEAYPNIFRRDKFL